MTKDEIIAQFDPSQPGLAEGRLYGLPFSYEQSAFAVLPVPWEVTVSYGSGTAQGPDAILEASYQVDLLHAQYPKLWQLGIYNLDAPASWKALSDQLRHKALTVIDALESGFNLADRPDAQEALATVNAGCRQLHDEVRQQVSQSRQSGKKLVLLGGDHSTPLGYYETLNAEGLPFGILHFDAHMDLRNAYEGFVYSHASIMHNALQLSQLEKLVQVGIRDFCESEYQLVSSDARVKVYTNAALHKKQFEGQSWHQMCLEIIDQLPQNVHVSIDIDALLAWYCPNTGTPVPGGLTYEQVTYMLDVLAESGKTIIGMDLVEVAPGETDWDGNVGARMLFHMCGAWAKNAGLVVGAPLDF